MTARGPAEVGTAIREARKEKGWSQEELARAARMSVRTLQDVEQGRWLPSLTTFALLAEALGMSLDALYHYARGEEVFRPPPDDAG